MPFEMGADSMQTKLFVAVWYVVCTAYLGGNSSGRVGRLYLFNEIRRRQRRANVGIDAE